MLNVYVGYVSDVKDAACGQRITAVIPSDEGKSPNNIPPAFPLLPKMIHIVPKIGEAVIVFVANDDEPNGQRYYLGPIISQPDKMNEDSFKSLSATRLLNNGIQPPDKSVTNFGSNFGALPERKDIALLGRKNTDIILTENELRVRAGCRLTKPGENKVDFNNGEPAFIKLKYHENGLPVKKNENEEVPSDTIRSTATVVADKINLLSHGAQEHFKLNDWEEGISDTEMQRIIENIHKLPYGDVLCDFLSLFIKMYESHVHPWHGMKPVVKDPISSEFFDKYGREKKVLEKKLLSENIGIN